MYGSLHPDKFLILIVKYHFKDFRIQYGSQHCILRMIVLHLVKGIVRHEFPISLRYANKNKKYQHGQEVLIEKRNINEGDKYEHR
jgi:hypothetical protein